MFNFGFMKNFFGETVVTNKNLLDHPAILRVHESTTQAKEVHIEVATNIYLGGRLYVASSEAPMILFWHGNGEIAADYDPIVAMYTRLGITFLVIDYRGYGLSDGIPNATSLIDDATTVLRRMPALLQEHGLTPSRLYVMGRSLGSAAAIEAATHPQSGLSGLIIESGFAFTLPLVERLGGFSPANTDEGQGFGNYKKMSLISLPTLIIHGEEDHIIPVSDGRALYRQSPAGNKRLLTIAEAGHNDLIVVGLSDYFESIRQFVFGNR